MKRWLSTAWMIGCTLILGFSTTSVWAQEEAARAWAPGQLIGGVISTVVYGLIGILMAILGFKLFDWAIPFNLEEEICEKQNIAVALLCAGMILGICIIIAVAVL